MPYTDGQEPAVTLPAPKPRRLHASWIAAGQRRRAARALRAQGWTYRAIGELFQISPETARRDCL